MGKCNIDHPHADVVEKFEGQKEFLPGALAEKIEYFLEQKQSQTDLNDLFHLLKKYDLETEAARIERDEKLSALVG